MFDCEFECVVVGNAGMDTNVFLYTPEIDFTKEGNFTLNLDTPGQAGVYASKCFAHLNLRTAFTGYLGHDLMGKYLLDDMDRYGIDTSGIKTDPAGTSRSINIMYPDGSRRNFYDGKSHMDLKAPERAFELLETTEIVHFNIPNWARHMLEFAKKRSGAVSCDLQDIRNMNDPYRKDFIENSDLIFFSSSEVGDPKVFLKGFLQKYPDKMFVTGMGKRGSGLGFKGSVQFFAPVSEETFKADPQNEMVKELLSAPVVDTNGAGDSLATGFIYGLFFLGLTPEESILTGQISARRTCSLKGTSDGLITENELLHLLKCAGVKIPCHSA